MKDINLKDISTPALAYLGDSVLELMVRQRLVCDGKGDIHSRALSFVTAVRQSEAFDRMAPHLSEDEFDVYKRGRNNTHSAPKSCTHAQYAKATGLECLFAYLHLAGENERLRVLFEIGYPDN